MAVKRQEGSWHSLPAVTGKYLLRPAASHFRLIALSSLDKVPFPSAYRQIYLPQWRFTADYERLFAAGQVPKRALNVAYTLQHLLELVSEGTGVRFTQVFTEAGTQVLGLGEVQEAAALVLGTEENAQRNAGKSIRKGAFKLPIIGVRHIEMSARTNRQTFLSFPRLPKLPLTSRDLKVTYPRSESTISMASIIPAPTPRLPTPTLQSEASLIDLFTANQVKSLQRDYMRLRHCLLPLQLSDFPQQTSSSPGLEKKKKLKFSTVFEVYMQEAAPVLREKPAQLFAAILRGAGADGEGLNWGQWLLVNAVLVYHNAPEAVTAAFMDKFMALSRANDSESQLVSISSYSDLIAALISPSQARPKATPPCSNSKHD